MSDLQNIKYWRYKKSIYKTLGGLRRRVLKDHPGHRLFSEHYDTYLEEPMYKFVLHKHSWETCIVVSAECIL